MSHTGYRIVDGVCSYKRISKEQKKIFSGIFSLSMHQNQHQIPPMLQSDWPECYIHGTKKRSECRTCYMLRTRCKCMWKVMRQEFKNLPMRSNGTLWAWPRVQAKANTVLT